MDIIVAKYNYWIYVMLMMVGMYAMLSKNNLLKKVIGMSIFQTAIIVFYVSTGAKRGASIPIIEHVHGHDAAGHAIEAINYVNPLPHVLMLTAIVVSVSTLGVALAIILAIHRRYGTTEEDELLEKLP
jgi:multicomponent Na+:H+ antiporter subunit C